MQREYLQVWSKMIIFANEIIYTDTIILPLSYCPLAEFRPSRDTIHSKRGEMLSKAKDERPTAK